MSDRQLFVPGEIVIIQSDCFPHLNGKETQILVAKHGMCMDYVTQVKTFTWHYICDTPPLQGVGPSWWNQSALRKKHKGCGESLKEVIKLCNRKPVGVRKKGKAKV